MRNRLYVLSLLLLTTSCAASNDERDDERVATNEEDLLMFRPPTALYVSNKVVTPSDDGVTVAFSTADTAIATLTVGTGVGTSRVAVASKTDTWPASTHTLGVSGLLPCTTYWYRIETRTGASSGTFSTSSARVDTFDVTRVSATYGQVHVRTSAPSAVQLNMTQNQSIGAATPWTVTMSNPSGLDHYYYFGINGPRYIAEALPSSCGGWMARWTNLDAWPSDYGDAPSPAPTGLDYPSARDLDAFHRVQGVAHSADSWFVSNQYGIHKFPRTADLNAEVSHPSVGIPADAMHAGGESDHVGDVDFAAGHLYAPLEHKEDMEAPPKVLFFDETLSYLGFAIIEQGATNEIPWVAINPIDGRLYTSTFDVSAEPGRQIRAYDIQRDWASRPIGLTRAIGSDFVLRDAAGNAMSVHGVQGGVFSPMGHFYISVDAPNFHEFGGVMGFEWPNGRQHVSMPIAYQPKVTTPFHEELEGLDLWDLAPGAAPGISGQIHVMMGNWTNRTMWFKHFALGTDAGRTLL
jgi:hypothetical protein